MDDNTPRTFLRLLAEVRGLLAVVRLDNSVSLDRWRAERLTQVWEAVSMVDATTTEVSPRELNLLEAIFLACFEVLDGIELPTEVSVRLAALRMVYQAERGRLFLTRRRSLEHLEGDLSDPARPPTRIFRRQRRRLYDLEIDNSSGGYGVH
jgi:hypothetical protein